jgi:hypothetical protein
MVYTEDGKSVYVTDNPTDITDGQRALPLYTKPRMLDAYKFITQWKGLTDEELMEILGYGTIERSQTKDFDFVDVIDVKLTRSLINAIEAKLKEKNGG